MRNSNGKTVVPIAALRPLLQEWVAKQNPDDGMVAGFMRTSNASNKGIGRLANDSGLPTKIISGVLNDNLPYKNITFDSADKLLCAMGLNSEWHNSLAEFYTELEVAPYERDRVAVLVTDAA